MIIRAEVSEISESPEAKELQFLPNERIGRQGLPKSHRVFRWRGLRKAKICLTSDSVPGCGAAFAKQVGTTLELPEAMCSGGQIQTLTPVWRNPLKE